MLIYICYLVIQGMLLNEQEGSRKMARYIDDRRMHHLYEKFVLEYYRKHYSELKASASQIDWDIDDGAGEFLPRMQSDITLQYQDKTLIIDTKYYEHTMQQNRFGDGRTLHSHNMYQIYTYVKNKDTTHSGKVSGVLLYAKTDEEIVPDHDYVIGGNRISVKTLDLNSTFSQIAKQLDALAERLLY
jgi:5-methylcytosine-specific restriction enzyme subunit McrC